MDKNVLGTELVSCGCQPKTGYFRDGLCRTHSTDYGTHVVCAEVTQEFLDFTRRRGNDLTTPRPEWDFPGLRAGDRWCLCITRWLEAQAAGVAPPVILEATHERSLKYTSVEILEAYGLKSDENSGV